jgi:histidinol-phosphate phosphatase family protein
VTQAIILAGGKGTRLSAQLQGMPKCLIDIDGTPLLKRQLQLLKQHGVDDVVLLVSHGADQVAHFLDQNDNFGIKIRLIDDGPPRGTSGAVLASLDSLGERFLVIYGDILMNVDLTRFCATHAASGADATLFLHPNDHPADSDLVEMSDDHWITAFHPYPHDPSSYHANLVNAALYVVEKRALLAWQDFKTPSDFGKDLFPAMLASGARLKGYCSFEYLKDIGTPVRLAKALNHLRQGVVRRASLTEKQKAVFIDRDGTLNVHRGFISKAVDLDLFPDAPDAVRRLNEDEYRVVVITNQPVIARGEASFADLRDIHAKLETLLGNHGAFLDAVYMCPHHPDKGFAGEVAALKMDCECRKPRTGMITQAVSDLNIDISRSWMVGDTTIDMETARRAGLRTILVRTGEAGRDGKYDVKADFYANNLTDAVAIIGANSETTLDH